MLVTAQLGRSLFRVLVGLFHGIQVCRAFLRDVALLPAPRAEAVLEI